MQSLPSLLCGLGFFAVVLDVTAEGALLNVGRAGVHVDADLCNTVMRSIGVPNRVASLHCAAQMRRNWGAFVAHLLLSVCFIFDSC